MTRGVRFTSTIRKFIFNLETLTNLMKRVRAGLLRVRKKPKRIIVRGPKVVKHA